MSFMYVTYEGDADTRFDRDYYVASHIPIVMAAWQPYGLLSCDAFLPATAGAGTIAVAQCRFRDEAALQAALASPETPGVMADVVRFTDATPEQHVPAPVRPNAGHLAEHLPILKAAVCTASADRRDGWKPEWSLWSGEPG